MEMLMLVAHVHGEIELKQATPDGAQALQEELELARELRNARSEAIALFSLSRVALLEGDTDDAAACLDGSLRLSIPLGEPTAFFECLVRLAEVAVKRGDMARAARLLGAADALGEEIDSSDPGTANSASGSRPPSGTTPHWSQPKRKDER